MMTARGRARHQHQRTFSPTFFFWKIIIKKELGISCCARAYEIHYNTRMKEGEKKKKTVDIFLPPFLLLFLSSQERLWVLVYIHIMQGTQQSSALCSFTFLNTDREGPIRGRSIDCQVSRTNGFFNISV